MGSAAQDIPTVNTLDGLTRTLSNSLSVTMSTSPIASNPNTLHSPSSYFGAPLARTLTTPKLLKPFDAEDVKILLLENVNQSGQQLLREQGYHVEALKTSLPEAELIQKIKCERSLILNVEGIADSVPLGMFMSLVFDQKPSCQKKCFVKQKI